MTSPAAIEHLFDRIRDGYPAAELGGIYANKPGYHNARRNLPSSDYSVQRADDQKGSADNASALDVTLRDPDDMARLTSRLLALTDAADPHVQVLREFFGTVDGTNVVGRDVRENRPVTSDDSHLWHAHLSIYRRYSADLDALDDLADAILSTSSTDEPTEESEDEEMLIVTKANGAAYLLWGDTMMYAIENGDDLTALKALANDGAGCPVTDPLSPELFNRIISGRTKKLAD